MALLHQASLGSGHLLTREGYISCDVIFDSCLSIQADNANQRLKVLAGFCKLVVGGCSYARIYGSMFIASDLAALRSTLGSGFLIETLSSYLVCSCAEIFSNFQMLYQN